MGTSPVLYFWPKNKERVLSPLHYPEQRLAWQRPLVPAIYASLRFNRGCSFRNPGDEADGTLRTKTLVTRKGVRLCGSHRLAGRLLASLLVSGVLWLGLPVYIYGQGVVATVAAGYFPAAIAVNSATNKIYAANAISGDVTVIDGGTNATVTVSAGISPRAVAVNAVTNNIYVANAGSNDVTVINGFTNKAIQVAAGSFPSALAVNEKTNTIYILNYLSKSVTVVEGATNRATTTINLPTSPGHAGGLNRIIHTGIAINPRTNMIYVVTDDSDTVSVIDGATHAVTSISTGKEPVAVAVNEETNKIYVASRSPHTAGTVTVIDGATNKAATITTGSPPHALAVNPVTNKIYVANEGTNQISAMDGTTSAATMIALCGPGFVAVAIDPVMDKIYVTNTVDNKVSVIDGGSNTGNMIAAGKTPQALAVNPITHRVYVANSSGANVIVIDGNIPITPLAPSAPPNRQTSGPNWWKTRLLDQTFLIRGFYQPALLQFDQEGRVLGQPEAGDWTTSGIEIKYDAVPTRDGFELRGDRIVWGYDEPAKSLKPYATDLKVTLQIKTDPTKIEESTFDELIRKILIPLPYQGEGEALPAYWHRYLGTQAVEAPLCSRPSYLRDQVKQSARKDASVAVLATDNSAKDKVYGINSSPASTPRPIFTPSADYSDAARKVKYNCTVFVSVVVNREGRIENPQIVKPCGYGLDEQTIKSLSSWSFQPATHDGKPVAAQVNLQEGFNIH